MGIELEVDGGGHDSQNAQELLNIGNKYEEHIYIKHDGSLDDGFEIVSHPATPGYHLKHMKWREICSRAVELGYTSHQAGTCGLHIHVSKDCFGSTYREQEEVIARILYFVEAHFNEMLCFSRRTQSQLDRWAARYGYKDQPKDILYHAKNSNMGRYTAINLQNYDTIEFRMFRGTLKYNTFAAVVQLVENICNAAVSMSDEQFKAMSWQRFVTGIQDAPELIEYLKSRRLYVNEEITTEEEI
ncbi:MAG: amidoligase family protein [Eubacteriales bacterium]